MSAGGARIPGLVLVLLLLAACGPPPPLELPSPERPRIIVISVDGLRPDAIEAAGATTLLALRREGAHAALARTIIPSRTLPSHTSMLTGVGVETHGITWNDERVARRGHVSVPTVFSLAHDRGLRTGAVMGKAKLRHLVRPGSLDYWSAPEGTNIRSGYDVAADAVQLIEHGAVDLLFVHLPDPDVAGHAVGWLSDPYYWAVRRADAAVERIVEAAVDAYGANVVLIVTGDHGGHERGHGSPDPFDVDIPWIAWGAGVDPGVIRRTVRTQDTAATVLWLLGIPVGEAMEGVPVRSAFLGSGVTTP